MKSVRIAALLIAFGLSVASAFAQPSTQIELAGAPRTSQQFDAAALAAFSEKDIASFAQTRSGTTGDSRSTVRGVRLSALVERAGLAGNGRDDWKTLVVIATATDGYRAVFSWPELANTAVGDGVLVPFERDGKPLDDREGRIALMSTADRKLGARHVRNLVRIEVRALP